MATPVDIANQALAHLGDRRIDRIDDDAANTDALSRYCAEFYDQARQEVLAAHRWSFAKSTAELALRADVTVIGYTYAHQKPSGFIRLLRLIPGTQVLDVNGDVESVTYPDSSIDKFKIVGMQIWSQYADVAMEYIQDVNDPDEWTPHFRAAVARLLASYLAGPTSDNPDESNKQKRIYETVDLPNAQYYDAVQDNSGENSDHETRIAGSNSLQSRYSTRYGSTDPSDYSY